MGEATRLPVPRSIEWASRYLEERGVLHPRLNAELLLAHVTGKSRVELYARPEAEIPPDRLVLFGELVRRRGFREPLQYIVGRKGFRYLELVVDRRVLIPRPETEVLVERALELLRSMRGRHPVVVDVGTGSGCIALSICRECPQSQVYATDISEDALQVARLNASLAGLEGLISFHLGDLLSPLPPGMKGRCDLVVSNPPYVSERDYPCLPEEVREHEPRVSLVAGPSGMEVHLRLMEQAPEWLAPGGFLLMEMGEDQGEELKRAARELGYSHVRVHQDLCGRPRVLELGFSRVTGILQGTDPAPNKEDLPDNDSK